MACDLPRNGNSTVAALRAWLAAGDPVLGQAIQAQGVRVAVNRSICVSDMESTLRRRGDRFHVAVERRLKHARHARPVGSRNRRRSGIVFIRRTRRRFRLHRAHGAGRVSALRKFDLRLWCSTSSSLALEQFDTCARDALIGTRSGPLPSLRSRRRFSPDALRFPRTDRPLLAAALAAARWRGYVLAANRRDQAN